MAYRAPEEGTPPEGATGRERLQNTPGRRFGSPRVSMTSRSSGSWAIASALVDEVCGSKGNILVSGEGGLGTDLEVYFARCVYRGRTPRRVRG